MMNGHALLQKTLLLALLLLLFTAQRSLSSEHSSFTFDYAYPGNMLVGSIGKGIFKSEEDFLSLARAKSLAVNEILSANRTDDISKLSEGATIILPSAWLIPDPMDDGIIINLAEKRLYYFYQTKSKKRRVATFPIGIGRTADPTPTGFYRVTDRIKSPAWYPPALSRRKIPTLPFVVPPGPENPLGNFWLQLSLPGYGIHGTNMPASIGNGISLGCIRLYPEHISWLFERVELHSFVEIIDEPVKTGFYKGKFYVEIHRAKEGADDLYDQIIDRIEERRDGLIKKIDFTLLRQAIGQNRGIPLRISK